MHGIHSFFGMTLKKLKTKLHDAQFLNCAIKKWVQKSWSQMNAVTRPHFCRNHFITPAQPRLIRRKLLFERLVDSPVDMRSTTNSTQDELTTKISSQFQAHDGPQMYALHPPDTSCMNASSVNWVAYTWSQHNRVTTIQQRKNASTGGLTMTTNASAITHSFLRSMIHMMVIPVLTLKMQMMTMMTMALIMMMVMIMLNIQMVVVVMVMVVVIVIWWWWWLWRWWWWSSCSSYSSCSSCSSFTSCSSCSPCSLLSFIVLIVVLLVMLMTLMTLRLWCWWWVMMGDDGWWWVMLLMLVMGDGC